MQKYTCAWHTAREAFTTREELNEAFSKVSHLQSKGVSELGGETVGPSQPTATQSRRVSGRAFFLRG